MYYIYMLRCEDNSIYTGITNNIERRIKEHFSKDEKCAKYTKSHNAKKVELVYETENKSLASKLEYAIKKLGKDKKENIIKNPLLLEEFFGNKLEVEKYKELKI